MRDRIKCLRKYLELSQKEFADRIHVSRNYIYQLESTDKPISKKFITLVCEEYNVNEDWLLTGEGDMFIEVNRRDAIREYMLSITPEEERSEIMMKYIDVLSELSTEQLKLVLDVAKGLVNNSTSE